MSKTKKRFSRIIGVSLIILLFVAILVAGASAATMGPRYPGTGTSVNRGTFPKSYPSWSNPARIVSDNNSYASVYIDNEGQSDYLYASNFGFNIPTDATINGITVDIGRYASRSNAIHDETVQLYNGSINLGNNKARSFRWSNSETMATYGGDSDTWGVTLTPDDINNSNFGVRLAVTSDRDKTTAYVDYIRLTVTYTEAASQVQVSYDTQGGTPATLGPKNVTVGSTYGELPSGLTKDGYTFAGWYTAANDGNLVTADTEVTATTNHTLYAQWTANTYTVTFDRNGGPVPSPTSKTVTFDQPYGALPHMDRTGYVFNGWYTAPIGGTKVESTTAVTTVGNHTLYAHWTARTYTVTFSGNGGPVPSLTSKQVTFNQPYGTLPSMYMTGYDFAGWFTAPTGGTKVTAVTLMTTPSNHTLYAQWLPRAYLVTFDPNGGSAPSPASEYVIYGVAYGQLPVVSRPGYDFAGWYTSPTSGVKVTADTLVATASNHTLFAHWTTANTHFFYDVNSTDWFYDPVMYVVNAGLFNGTSTYMFSPNAPMTRAMIVTVLYRLEGMPAVSGANPFDDVAPGMWYTDAVIWAVQNGIVTGYNDNTFGTDDSVTREQLVTILYRYAKYKGYDVSVGEDTNILSYLDAFEISEYAIPAMQWACGAGIIEGSAGNLMPAANATRAQVAAILMRFVQGVVKAS